MDLKSLIAKMDEIEKGLNEAFNIKTVQQQVGQIQDPGQRRAQLATLAQQNGLPGLYDPVDGGYVGADGRSASTASHEVDNLLASKGLMPKNANTSTFLGRMFGTSGDKYDQGLRGQSDKVVADQTSAEFKAAKFKELQDIMKQLSTLKKVDAPKPDAKATPAAGATPPAGQSGTPAPVKESALFADDLIESFGYSASNKLTEAEATLGQQAAVGGAAYGAAKVANKVFNKAIPGVGLAFGAVDAYNRAKKGDWVGAGLAGVSAGLSLIPGFGWIPAAAIDMFNIGRDMRGPTASAQGAMQHPVENGPIAQLQKIIGTEADGIFGPKSQAALKVWQQKKGLVADGIPGPKTFAAAGIKSSVQESKSTADQIKETAARLEELANPQPLLFLDDEGTMFALYPDDEIYSLNEGAVSDFWNALKTGWSGAKVATGALTKAGNPQMVSQGSKAFQKALAARPALQRGAYNTAKFVKNNPIKTAAALGAAGLAGGYAMGNDSGQGDMPPAGSGGSGGGGAGQGSTPPAPEAQQVCSPEQMALITKARGVMGELSDIADQDPALAQVLQTYQSQIDALNCGDGSAGQGATPAAAGGTPLTNFYNNIGKQ